MAESLLTSGLARFSSFLQNETENRKKELMYYKNYFDKQNQSEDLLGQLQQTGNLPDGFKVDMNDPTATLENLGRFSQIAGMIKDIKRSKILEGRQDLQWDQNQEDRTKQQELYDIQKPDLTRSVIRQHGKYVVTDSKDNSVTEIIDGKIGGNVLSPKLAKDFEALKEKDIDNARIARDKAKQPKTTNVEFMDGTGGLVTEFNGRFFDAENKDITHTIRMKRGVGFDTNTQTQNKFYGYASKERKKMEDTAKNLIEKYQLINEETKAFVDNQKDDRGFLDYSTVAESIFKPGKDIKGENTFFSDPEVKKMSEEYLRTKEEYELNSLKGSYDITDDKYVEIYNKMKEYLTPSEFTKFKELRTSDKIKMYYKKIGAENTATNPSVNQTTGKISVGDLFK